MSLDIYLTCEHCNSEVFSSNITHNLVDMAKQAGLYEACWAPERLDATRAEHISFLLRDGLETLKGPNAELCKALNPPNGWGTYEGFVAFVEEYLAACERWPRAKIGVWK